MYELYLSLETISVVPSFSIAVYASLQWQKDEVPVPFSSCHCMLGWPHPYSSTQE